MGAADAAAKEFMSIKQNFADAFNMGLFGEELIDPERLEDLDSNLFVGLFQDGETRVRREIERSLDDAMLATVLMADGDITYVLLGMEYQTEIHYAMPVRTMLDAILFYVRQIRELDARHRKEAKQEQDREARREKNRSSVFLSGMNREDTLNPVVILVVYLGEEPWDGPRSLGEMLPEKARYLLPWIGDWKINLITPDTLPDRPEWRQSELWKLMHALKAGRQSKEELMKLQQDKSYESVSPSMVRLINTLLHTNFEDKPEKGGTVNMCKAMREINDEINGYLAAMQKMTEENNSFRAEVQEIKEENIGYQATIQEQNDLIAQRDSVIAQRDSVIAQQDSVIAQQERENAMLRAKLAAAGLS